MANKNIKNFSIKWINSIPENWKLGKIYSIYKLRNTKVNDIDYPPLSVTNKGILPQLETVAKTNDGTNRKLVCIGDFVINSRSDRRGSCGISPYEGSVSLINIVLQPRNKMIPHYFDWLFHTINFSDEFYRWGHGIVDDLWTTNWDDMKKIVVPIPPLKEQKLIADYLDNKCSEIDKLKEDITKQINILKEYKQSLITETVTKGLDSNVPMKNSGIDWIGEIPKHWHVIKFKYVTTSLYKGNGITKEDIVEQGDFPCLRYGEIYSKYNYKFKKCLTRTNKNLIDSKKFFSYGDILFAGTGELIEEIGKNIVYLGNQSCLAGGDIIIAKHFENPLFLSYALNSQYVQNQKSCGKAKLKVVHISRDEIGNLIICLPPIIEQNKIANYLDNKCNNIDKIISSKEKQLNTLEEYKKSLIYEYVTGKKEVPQES